MSNLAKIASTEYSLQVLSGPEKGSAFKLVSGRITIGRGSENTIILKDDPKISRNHAILIVTATGVQISDVSDRNKILVNGQEVTNMALPSGAIVQLGETKFRFNASTAEPDHTVNLAPDSQAGINVITGGSNIAPAAAPDNKVSDFLGRGGEMGAPSSRRRRTSKSGSGVFYIVAALVGIIFVWLLTSKPNSAIDATKTNDDSTVAMSANDKSVEAMKAERERAGFNSQQYKDAQQNFVKGFRDYSNGQYRSAIDAFQACRSLFPQHEQCKRYFELSRKKYEELYQYHMIMGGKYKDQNQFKSCMAEYRNVMVMVEKDQKIYQEAFSGFKFCEAQTGDKY